MGYYITTVNGGFILSASSTATLSGPALGVSIAEVEAGTKSELWKARAKRGGGGGGGGGSDDSEEEKAQGCP